MGLTPYTINSVVPQLHLGDIFRRVVPYLLIELALLIVIILVPDNALWLPGRIVKPTHHGTPSPTRTRARGSAAEQHGRLSDTVVLLLDRDAPHQRPAPRLQESRVSRERPF